MSMTSIEQVVVLLRDLADRLEEGAEEQGETEAHPRVLMGWLLVEVYDQGRAQGKAEALNEPAPRAFEAASKPTGTLELPL